MAVTRCEDRGRNAHESSHIFVAAELSSSPRRTLSCGWRLGFQRPGVDFADDFAQPILGTRSLSHWVARLTLIAYLVGGWIIPSIHHHGGHGIHGHGHGHTACASATHSNDTRGDHVTGRSNAWTEPQVCGHGCEHSSVSTQDEPATGTGTQAYAASSSAVESHDSDASGCGGSCAVCLARTLASERFCTTTLSIAIRVAERVELRDASSHPLDLLGLAPSRGPPVSV